MCTAKSDTLLQVFVLGEIATEVFQDNPTIFFQVNVTDLKRTSASLGRLSLLFLSLQDVKRGRYPKLQSIDSNITAVTSKLGLQVESRTAGTGISLLTAETVRSLMLDKRKVNLLLQSVPCTGRHATT